MHFAPCMRPHACACLRNVHVGAPWFMVMACALCMRTCVLHVPSCALVPRHASRLLGVCCLLAPLLAYTLTAYAARWSCWCAPCGCGVWMFPSFLFSFRRRGGPQISVNEANHDAPRLDMNARKDRTANEANHKPPRLDMTLERRGRAPIPLQERLCLAQRRATRHGNVRSANARF